MSIHTWKKDYQVWLLDSDFKPTHLLPDLRSFAWEWKLRDFCNFTASLPVSSRNYQYIDSDVDQYLYVRRDTRGQVFKIELHDAKWKPINGKRTLALDMGGQGGALFFLGSSIIQPNQASSDITLSFTGYIDDIIKDFVRYSAVVGTCYADPDANARGIPGLSVAANKTEHPTTTTIARTGNLWEVVRALCLDYDIDITLTPTWNGSDAAITFELETYYEGRGTDRTAGTANPCILSDVYKVFTDSAWHYNKFPEKTHAYRWDAHDIVAATTYTSGMRREVIVDADNVIQIREAMLDMRAEQGHTLGFRESLSTRLGTEFWTGDTVPHLDTLLGTDTKDELVGGWRISIQPDELGSEDIELIFGDDKPRENNRGGKPKRRPTEGPDKGSIKRWTLDGDTGTAVPTVLNAITVAGGTDITTAAADNTVTVNYTGAGSTFAAPTVTFGAAHAEGASTAVMRSDATFQLQMAGDAGAATFGGAGNTLTLTGGVAIDTSAADSAVTITHAAVATAIPDAHHDRVTLTLDLTDNPLTISGQELGLAVQAHSFVFIGPQSGEPAAPTFREFEVGDLPDTVITTADLATPTITFDTAYAAGTALTLIRSDAVLQLQVSSDSGGAVFGDAGNTLNVVGSGGVATSAADNTLTIDGTSAGTCFWQRSSNGTAYLHQTTHGDELRLYNDADGLVWKIDADGNVTGSELAVGTPYLSFSITDYDIVGSGGSGSGVHDLTFSGNLTSAAGSSASIASFLGGSDGEDQLQARNITLYNATAASNGATILDATAANGLRLWQAINLNLYSGDPDTPGTNTVSIDGATGNAVFGGTVTAQGSYLYLTDANTFLRHANGTGVYLQTDDPYVVFSPGGAQEVAIEQGAMWPLTTNVTKLGDPTHYWSALYCTTGTFSGTVTAGRYNVVDATNYITITGTVFANYANTTWAAFAGGTAYLVAQAGVVRRGTLAACDLGHATYPWDNLYANKYYDGDNNAYYMDLSSAGTALNANGNIITQSVVNAVTGFQHNGVAPLGNVLLGDGTNFVSAANPFIRADGTVPLTAAWDAGSWQIRALTFQSDVATGTAPFTVASITKVANLNADYLDGYTTNAATAAWTVVVRNGSSDIYAHGFFGTVAYYLVPHRTTFSLVIAGGITMQAGKTVDGVDISVFYTAYGAHGHTITGATGDWTTYGGTLWSKVYDRMTENDLYIIGYFAGKQHTHSAGTLVNSTPV